MTNERRRTIDSATSPPVMEADVESMDRSPRVARPARPSDEYIPPSVLPVPESQDGWDFRWIRTSAYGKTDNTNVSRKFREGWEPVLREEHKELMIMSDRGSQFKGNIEVGGLLLCKAPTELMDKRREYFVKKAANQMQAVDLEFLSENDPRMPQFIERKTTRNSFGK